MKYTIWAKDRYGRHEIMSSLSVKGVPENEWNTPLEALAAAKRYVHDQNRNNALTFDEQKRLTTCLLVEMNPNDSEHVYAGDLIHGRHKMIKIATGEEVILDGDIPVKFYMGQTPDNQPWYLEDPRRRLVTSLEDQYVTERTLLFVHAQEE